jgi:CheY-like chemotaxis protein
MASNSEPVKPEASTPQILLVDDSAAARRHARTVLDVLDCSITEAGDGANALALLAARDFDLVITDLEMTPVDGATLIAAIERLAPRRRPKVIVCSVRVGDRSLAYRPELRGAAALLEKPVRTDALLLATAAALKAGRSTP